MEIINQLPSNPWAWLFISIITIGGFILAYRSTPQKVIKCKISSNVLITKRQSVMSKLDILYDGKNIDNLTVSRITFWNNSFPTIHNTDIIDVAPLSIFINDGEILDISVMRGGDTPNRISVACQSENVAKILFDYIDRKEGGIIQVVHTGGKKSIDVSRKIKGGKIVIVKNSVLIEELLVMVSSTIITLMGAYCGAKYENLIAVQSAISTLGIEHHSPEMKDYLSIFIMPVLYVVFVLIVLLIWRKKKKFIPQNCRDISGRYKVGILTRIKDKLQG